MDLLAYISDMDRRAALADACSTSPDYLWQIATGRRQAGTELAKTIERESGRIGPKAVAKETVRPDVWEPVKKKARAA